MLCIALTLKRPWAARAHTAIATGGRTQYRKEGWLRDLRFLKVFSFIVSNWKNNTKYAVYDFVWELPFFIYNISL